MTEQTNAELIAEARLIAGHYEEGDATGDFIEKLTDALEAADQRADLADADLEVEQQKNAGYRSRNDALAAVIEQTEDFVTRHYLDTRFGDEVLPLLAAPADALRELKADVWDEGFDAGFAHGYGDGTQPDKRSNPYRAREEQGRG